MNKFPSITTMVITILILAVMSGLKFSRKLERAHFQLKFDWKNEKEIQRWDNVIMDSMDYNFIRITGADRVKIPDNQNTFAVQAGKSNKFYFRFIDQEHRGDTLILKAVEWLTGVPEWKPTIINLTEYDVPLDEKSGKSIVTIGDEMLIKDEAKYFRRKMATLQQLRFEGSIKDVFNYRHEADYQRSLTSVIQTQSNISSAAFYVLFFNSDPGESKEEAEKLITILSERSESQKIVWIYVPYKQDLQTGNSDTTFIQFLKSLQIGKLSVIDGSRLFAPRPDLYFMQDGKHLNKLGYEKLAEETTKLLR